MAGVAVLGIGIASYLLAGWQRQRPAATAGSIRSIAVLPLDNYSGDASQDYFAEGMTDEITADLATISQLRVISRGSAMQFKAKERPPTPEIGRRLNVDAVIEGSVSRSGETRPDHRAVNRRTRGQAPLGGDLRAQLARRPVVAGRTRRCHRQGNRCAAHADGAFASDDAESCQPRGARCVSARAFLLQPPQR